jgi:hypothetical protein
VGGYVSKKLNYFNGTGSYTVYLVTFNVPNFNDTGSYTVRLFTFEVPNSALFANNIAIFVDS